MAALAVLPAAVMVLTSWLWVPGKGEWNPRLYAVALHNLKLNDLRNRLMQDIMNRPRVVKTEPVIPYRWVSKGRDDLPSSALSPETVFPLAVHEEEARNRELLFLNSVLNQPEG